MKPLLLSLLTLVSIFAFGQGPGAWHYESYPSINYTSNGSTQVIKWHNPYDSTSSSKLHPVIICMEGIGERGTFNNSQGTAAWLCDQGASMRFANAIYGGFSTFVVITPYLPTFEGEWPGSIAMDIIAYLKKSRGNYIDTTQIYVTGFSLGGGGVYNYISRAVGNGAQIAAAGVAEGTGNYTTVADLFGNINTNHLPVRNGFAETSTNGSTLANMQQLHTYQNTTYSSTVPLMLFDIWTAGGHQTSAINTFDTAHTALNVDSSYLGPYGNSHTNVAHVNNPSLYEWFLQFYRSPVIPPSPPSCTTNTSPANGSLLTTASTADLAWNYAATASSYDLYLYIQGGSLPAPINVSGLTYHATGLTYNAIYKWYVVPKNAVGSATGCATSFSTFTTALLPDIIGHVYNVIDVAGYGGNDPNEPLNFFDANGQADPLNGVTTDTTSINNPSHGWDKTVGGPLKFFGQYFHDSTGKNFGVKYYGATGEALIIVDFTGRKDWNDVRRKFLLHHISGLNKEEAGLKIRLWNFDALYNDTSYVRRKLYLARYDSMMQPFDSIITDGSSSNWITRNTNQSMRYMGISIQLGSDLHVANFGELVPYGYYNFTEDPTLVRQPYTGPLPNDTLTYGEVNGITETSGADKNDLKHYAGLRIFANKGGMDTSTKAGPPTALANVLATFPDVNFAYLQSLEAQGQHVYISWHTAKPYNYSVTNAYGNYGNAQIDDPALSPERAENYVGDAIFAYNYAALMGANAISTSNTIWPAGTTNGHNVAKRTSFGNEAGAHGMSRFALYIKKSAEWDGDEGRIGPLGRSGVRNADTGFVLIDEPEVAFNPYSIVFDSWAAGTFRRDQVDPYNQREVHEYFTDRDKLPGIYFDLDQEVGQKSIVPARVYQKSGLNLISYQQKAVSFFYTYMPLRISLIIGENGISNYGTPAPNAASAQTWDHYVSVPFFGDSLMSKAVKNSQYNVLYPFVKGLKERYEYNFDNENPYPQPDTLNYNQIFESHGVVRKHSTIYPFSIAAADKFPAYFIDQHQDSMLHSYRRDSLFMGDTLNAWVARYKNRFHPDSMRAAVFRPTENADSSFGNINLHTSYSGNVVQTIPSFNNVAGRSQTLTASAGIVNARISPLTAIYTWSETAASAPGCTTNLLPANNDTTANTSATLTWNAAALATSYKVYLYLDSLAAPSSPSYTVSGTSVGVTSLLPGKKYRFYIVPSNSVGDPTGCGTTFTRFNVPVLPPNTKIWILKRGSQ